MTAHTLKLISAGLFVALILIGLLSIHLSRRAMRAHGRTRAASRRAGRIR